jgi:photosystem I P700 chlorophyll a apoprotein A1
LRFSTLVGKCNWGTVNASGISHITGGNFAQSANTINGCYVISHNRHKLFNHTVLLLSAHDLPRRSLYLGIQSYVLFSGRGYWQELIESIVWAHNKLKVVQLFNPALAALHSCYVACAVTTHSL